MNLTYINVAFTGKVLRWKLYLQDKNFDLYHVPGKEVHQFVPDALSRLCANNVPMMAERMIVALIPMMVLPLDVSEKLKKVHNSQVIRHLPTSTGRRTTKARRAWDHGSDDQGIHSTVQVMNRMRLQIKTHRFTCASYNPFEVLHLDHIGPLTKDAHGNEYILVIIYAFSRWVELFLTKSTTALETASVILNHIGRFGTPEVIHHRTDTTVWNGTFFCHSVLKRGDRYCGACQSRSAATFASSTV